MNKYLHFFKSLFTGKMPKGYYEKQYNEDRTVYWYNYKLGIHINYDNPKVLEGLQDTMTKFQNINLNKGKDMGLDSIQDITNWFKAAKPNPTAKDALVQQGCHFEEVIEHLTSIGIESEDLCDLSNNLKCNTRLQSDDAIANYMDTIDYVELLDSLCDQIVTSVGVGYMMDFDMLGALCEVIRSNNSKMVDGKFIFDDNGKIMKPDTYSEPDLIPYLKKF
jgi:predicted HAD superfamily Cof-like phosphohydrolase